jgi:thiol-disulfide isomerase/thioredoxin
VKRWASSVFALGLILVVAGLVRAAPAAATAAPEDPWQTRLPAFSVDAPPRGEAPILLYFTAPWCGFCKQMERGTLADAEVRARVSRVRAHKIDFDAQRGLAERFAVRGIPALVMTNDRGEVIDRLTGANRKEVFLAWVEEAEGKARRQAQAAEERLKQLATLYPDLYAEDAERREKAMLGFWARLGRGDEMERKTAGETFERLLADEKFRPLARHELWLVGLGHGDLAVRCAASNRLRAVHPEAAKLYDPWAEETVRREALARLKF